MAEYTPLTKYNDPIDRVPNVYPELKSVLFSPGVHYMRDPRTKRINFSPSLLNIPHVDNFKFNNVDPFISPSHDTKLLQVANGKNNDDTSDSAIHYYSSTSSLTGILRQFHILLSNNRPLDTSFLSKSFPSITSMSASSKYPVCSVVTPKEKCLGDSSKSIYSIDSDRSADTELILSCLGNVIELMLTKDSETFKKYLKDSKEDPINDDAGSAYHYAKFGKFLMRSQLDAKDVELPGTGVFDLKTRAVCAIRYDISHADFFPTNYEINRTDGLFESFEREIFEMAKIVMFKYGLQARIGNMDGIMVAYHNVKNILGFQYFPLSGIDDIFFGHTDPGDVEVYRSNRGRKGNEADTEKKLVNIVNDIGLHWQNKREALSTLMAKHEFKVSLTILQDVMDKITEKTKDKPFRMILKYLNGDSLYGGSSPRIEVIVNVIDDSTIDRLTVLGDEKLQQDKTELSASQNKAVDEILPSERIKEMSLDRARQKKRFERLNGEIFDRSFPKETFMFQVTCQNLFDGKPCEQKYPTPPLNILDKNSDFKWEVDYSIDEIQDRKYIKDRYFRNISHIAMHSFIGASSGTASSVPPGLEEHYLDRNATFYQNVLRAYSAKAVKRGKLFKNSVFSKGRK